jgi:hypothetical protein
MADTHLTIMIGDTPSTKHYKIEKGIATAGKVLTSYYHDSATVGIQNLSDLYEQLAFIRQDANAFIIRAAGVEAAQHRVLRRLTEPENFKEQATAWVCLDFDKYEVPPSIERTSQDAIEYLIETILPVAFRNVSYIYQWSSSAGLEYNDAPVKTGTNVHLFFYLDRALLNTEFKAWFHKQIHEGFDPSTFNSVLPIFVGNHIVKDDAIVDIIPDNKKFGIVPKKTDVVKVPNIKAFVAPVRSGNLLPDDTTNEILLTLNSMNAIYHRGANWIKLKHPGERTPGDWFVKPSSPMVVHHHVKKSMRVDRWIKEFYGIDVDIDFPTDSPITNRKSVSATLALANIKNAEAF